MTPTAGTTDPNLPHKPRLSSRDMCRWAKTNRHAAHYARRSYGQWHKESGSKHVVLFKGEHEEGSSVAGGTGRASVRRVRNGMRAGFRPDQAGSEEQSRIQSSAGQARGEEEGRGKSSASEEEDRDQRSAGQAGGEEKNRGRSGGLAEEGGRSEEEGGDRPQGRKRPTEEGRRASEEGRRPRPEGEEVVAGDRDEALLVGARGPRRTERGSTRNPTS